MTFGERLTSLRIEKGYTKRNEFADILGIPSTTLRNYETDVREPGHRFLKQVSALLEVSVDYLLCLTDEREKTDSYQLKFSEYEHIKKYRDLDPHGKDMVDTVLEKEHSRYVTIKQKLQERGIEVLVPGNDYLEVDAACPDVTATDDDRKRSDLMMYDDSEWK